MSQGGFKEYFKQEHDKNVFRHPDEAYIVIYPDDRPSLVKILEKKNQTQEGSAETKLYAAEGMRCEMQECLGNGFDVRYAFCLSAFFKIRLESTEDKYKKYRVLKGILGKWSVKVMYGDDADYFGELDAWIYDCCDRGSRQ